MSAGVARRACDACLRRTALLAAVAGNIEIAWRRGLRPRRLLALDDDALAVAVAPDRAAAGRIAAHAAGVPTGPIRAAIDAAGLEAVCRCDDRYPAALRNGPDPPAVVHVLGGVDRLAALAGAPGRCAAVVGARRASPYGLDVARALGHGLAVAGATTVSGMALGIDTAAHAGALAGGGPTVAVLAGGADVAYPASRRALHRCIAEHGCVVSELPPGFRSFRWGFPARNRIIAGLAAATVVVEAATASGALITADFAADLGREVGAVPGRVTAPQSAGTNALLHGGAHVVRTADDVLALLDPALGTGHSRADAPDPRAALPPALRALHDRVAGGATTPSELAGSGDVRPVLVGLAELELLGLVVRRGHGRYAPAAPGSGGPAPPRGYADSHDGL